MIRKFLYFSLPLLSIGMNAMAQDNCASAVSLCAGSSISRSTIGATTVGTDPSLSCGDAVVNNSVWFTVLAINNGNCTITVNNINNNPGLDMEVYTGACGSLVSIGQCASGNSGTGGTMNVSFATVGGTLYYIMVDGNTGNQEAFDIIATTPNDAIVARPDANFNVNPSSGCVPLSSLFQASATILHGGSNITYDWKIDAGSYIPSTGADTTMLFNSIGTSTVTLKVCNQQCGCKQVSQDIVIQDLFPVISYNPPTGCVGTTIFFDGNASILPDPPFVDPNVTDWDWDFGDPASGVNNSANGQNVSHIFAGAGPNFTVRLIIQGTCGPDTTFSNITLLSQPIVTISGPTEICEGLDVNLNSNVSNAALPVTYDWVGAGSYSCTNCPATTISNLPFGGPYTIDLSITDSLGCTADTSIDVTINENPTVFAGGFITVCHNDSAQLNAAPSGGIPPYQFQWSPSAGLNSDTIINPFTYNTIGSSYCVTVTDSKGCASNPDCVNIDEYPQPVIIPASINLCTTSSPLTNTFTVVGANPGSSYSWALSPSYAVITSAALDSSDITATFPPVAASYDFTAIVTDAVTGCIDTLPVSFSVVSGLNMNFSGQAVICAGDSATLNVSGANTYAWTASPAIVFADSTSSVQVVSPPVTTVFTITGTTGTCTQIITDTLTVSPKPVAFINPIPPFCGCFTVTLDGFGSTPAMTYQWISLNGSFINSPTSIITPAQICGIDSIFLIVTDTASGCQSTDSTVTVAHLKPDAQISVNPNLICNGTLTVINLDATGSNTDPLTTYLWSSTPAVVIADTTAYPNTTASVSSATVFYLTVADSAGCDSTVSDTVQIYPSPTISADFPFLCTSDPILQSTLTVSGASVGSTYSWDTIPACAVPSSTIASSQLFDFGACGTASYNFSVTVNDPVTTCITVLSQTVSVVNGVTLVLSNDTAICEGSSATLNVGGANSFVWTASPAYVFADPTDPVQVVSPIVNTMFIVTGTIGSCVATDTINITVNPVPVTSPISGFSSVCENDPASVYTVSPTVGNYTWTVTGGIVVAQVPGSIIVNWSSTGIGFISVIDTNAFGCAGILQTLNVTINPLPVAPTVTGPDTVCDNDIASYFVIPNAGSVYTWSISGGNIVTGTSGAVNSFQWTNPGLTPAPGSLDVFEISSAGCSGPTTTFNVLVDPRPQPLIVSGSSLVCDNITEIYSLIASPGSVYSWNVTNDLQDTLNITSDSLAVDWGNPGSGQISVFETNIYGCISGTLIVPVNINQHPSVSIPNDSAALCNNVSFQIVANSTPATIRWYTDGSGTFNDTTIASAIYTPAITDTGYIHLTMVSSNAPCANDTGKMVLYLTQSPIVTITGPVAPICYGTIDSLRATGGGTYIWTPGGIPSAVIGIRPLVTTTYTVAVTNSFNCTTFDTITVTVIPPGIPNAGADAVICIGDSVLLNGSQQNATGLLWSTLGDGVFIPDSISPAVNYIAGPSDTTINSVDILLVSTGACYNLTDTVHVTIQHHPFIDAGNDTTLSTRVTTGVTVPLSPQANSINGLLWTTTGTGTFTPSDTTLNAVYTPSTADFDLDSLLLIITTAGSCAPVSDTVIVEFAPFVIPNIFTPYPASPGQNDYFVIQYITPHSILKVWDRWGSLVYTSDYYQNDWDAHGLKGDIYYYLVITEDKKYRGWVEVMR